MAGAHQVAIRRFDLTAAVHAPGEHRGELSIVVTIEVYRHGEVGRLEQRKATLSELHPAHDQTSALKAAVDELKRGTGAETGHQCTADRAGGEQFHSP
jgi:hypothetical protein